MQMPYAPWINNIINRNVSIDHFKIQALVVNKLSSIPYENTINMKTITR